MRNLVFINVVAVFILSGCFREGGFDGLSYEEKANYVSGYCEEFEGTSQWRSCIDEMIDWRSGKAKKLNRNMKAVAGAVASMPTMSNSSSGYRSQSKWDNGNGFLESNTGSERVRGNLICYYTDGSAINVGGTGICPLSI